jgi:hypothetical protein
MFEERLTPDMPEYWEAREKLEELLTKAEV